MRNSPKSPSTWALTGAALLLCIYIFYRDSLWVLYGSYDTGWLVQTGQYLLQHGIPTQDIFSWSNPSCPYVVYQWLFAALLAMVFQTGSLWLVGFITCIFVGLLIFFFLPRVWTGKGIPLFLPLVFLALVQTPHWFNARPQLASFYFTLIFIWILERYRANGGKTKWLASLPLLMAAWVNIHSFWCVGLLLMVTYLGCDIWRRRQLPVSLVSSCLLTFLAILINPYGIGAASYLWTFFNGSHYTKIWELLPWFTSTEVVWTILFVPIAWWILIAQRKKVPLEGFILSAIFTMAALVMRRFEPLAVIISWNYLGLALTAIDWKKYQSLSPPRFYKPILQFAMAMAVPIITWYSQFPTMMSAWMVYTEDSLPLLTLVQQRTTQEDRLFCAPQIGSWLIGIGGLPVFIDTRFDMYPKPFVDAANDCLDGKAQWSQTLDTWGITEIVCGDDTVLNQNLLSSDNWTMALDDGMFNWWVRNTNTTDEKMRLWLLSDEQLGSSELPPHIRKATIETRAARYLRLARIYLKQGRASLAMDATNRGLLLLPDSRALHEQSQLCTRVLGNPTPL